MYTSTHGRFALSRRRATALFHNPVCKAQRSVPGFSSTPNSACRRYATSPPSAVAYIIGLLHPARCITKKTAEERFNMLARGWLAYPVTPIHSLLPPKSGCRSHIPRLANPMTPTQTQSPCKQLLQPLFGGRFLIQQLTPGRQANLGLRLYNRPSAVASPIKKPALINGLRQRRNAEKTAEERFHMLARGWLAYPVTPIHSLLPPKSGCICHPSVCKSNDTHTNAITLRIIYPTVLRRLPLPSKKTPSSTLCANYPFLISPTTTYLFFQQKH